MGYSTLWMASGGAQVTSLEFKTVASQVLGLDGINAFLTAYRETYGADGALAPLVASEQGAGVASAG